MSVESFLSQLNVTATSPYAFFAYICLIAANLIIAWKIASNKIISNTLEKLPEAERSQALVTIIGAPIPDNISAAEWIKGRRNLYLFLSFLTLIICITAIVIITLSRPRDESVQNWKNNEVLSQVTPNTNRSFIVSKIGQGKQSDISDFLSVQHPIMAEVYSDPDAELILLYKDKKIIGELIRELHKSSFHAPILGSEREGAPWLLGKGTFSELNHQPDKIFEREHLGQSICRIEKHYFGAAGKYQNYYFSHNFSRDEDDIPLSNMRPDSLLIVNTDDLCDSNGDKEAFDECESMLRMLACTPSSDAI